MKPLRNDEALTTSPALSSDAGMWIWCAASEITQQLIKPGQHNAAKDQLLPKEAAMLAELLYELAGRLSNIDDESVSMRSLSMALLLWDRWED